MDKKEASTDVTYCRKDNCSNKCWRHTSNWKFDNNQYYWFMINCCKEDKEVENGNKSNK